MSDGPRKPKRPGEQGDDPKWWDEEAQRERDVAALRGIVRVLVDGIRYSVAEIRDELKRGCGKQ